MSLGAAWGPDTRHQSASSARTGGGVVWSCQVPEQVHHQGVGRVQRVRGESISKNLAAGQRPRPVSLEFRAGLLGSLGGAWTDGPLESGKVGWGAEGHRGHAQASGWEDWEGSGGPFSEMENTRGGLGVRA